MRGIGDILTTALSRGTQELFWYFDDAHLFSYYLSACVFVCVAQSIVWGPNRTVKNGAYDVAAWHLTFNFTSGLFPSGVATADQQPPSSPVLCVGFTTLTNFVLYFFCSQNIYKSHLCFSSRPPACQFQSQHPPAHIASILTLAMFKKLITENDL